MKREKITKLNTGLTTMIDGKGKIHVFTNKEINESKEDWKSTAKFLIQIVALGGGALLLTYLFEK